MSCPVCDGHGIARVGYEDGTPDDFAVCLCPAGIWFRSNLNAGKPTDGYGWQVWAAKYQIAPDRLHLVEDIATPSELAEKGLSTTGKGPQGADREAALLAAGRSRKAKL